MQPTNDNQFRDLRTLAGAISAVILALHFYYYCYRAFADLGLTYPIIDRIVKGAAHYGLFRRYGISKLIALAGLAAASIGAQAIPRPKGKGKLFIAIVTGLPLYFGGDIILSLYANPVTLATLYIIATLAGLGLLYTAIKTIAGLFAWSFRSDVFNQYNESFPQEERLLSQPFSIHFRARYRFRNQLRNSMINLVDIFRGSLVIGKPGSGKTRYIFREMIRQSLANGMALFVYDLKYDDLTRLTYNTLEHLKGLPPNRAEANLSRRTGQAPAPQPEFFCVNFDDFSRSHRCNPLDPASLDDISDAGESARTILYALNRKFVHMQGDFFVESAVGFFTANIWFLRRYENGKYCTLAHLLELIQCDFYRLFSILRSIPEAETLISPFVSALANNTHEQLQGQVDSARIALSTLVSPQIYYLLSANDFTLDVNNPQAPKVICLGSNPQKQHVYGAIISLYVSRMLKLVNRKGGTPCHLFFDEFPSFYCHNMDLTLATARSNRVAVTIGIQDLAQLRSAYGRDHADALFNLPGNILCGQVSGDTARLVSEQFGKILQEKSTISTNSRDSSTSQSLQLDLAVPASKIANLSSGEFVGVTADSPAQRIALKGFHGEILIDHAAIDREEARWKTNPQVRTVTPELVDLNFRAIKQEVRQMVEDRLAYMAATPALARLIVKKKEGLHGRWQTPG
jgi:hypothetical protein